MADPAYIVDGVLTDGEAWVGIATTTLESDTAEVTFTSTDDGQVGDFSQYMDLVVISYVRSAYSGSGDTLKFQFNDDAGANYPNQFLRGSGASASAGTYTYSGYAPQGAVIADNNLANAFSCVVSHLFDINSGKYKSNVAMSASDSDSTYGYFKMDATTWLSQAPITKIDIYTGGDLKDESQFSLFGVLPRMVA